MVRRARVAQVHAPQPRHDHRQLENAIIGVKASFKVLDTSGAKLERAIARSRTRLLSNILGEHAARKAADEKAAQPPRRPAAGGRPPRAGRGPPAGAGGDAAGSATDSEGSESDSEYDDSEGHSSSSCCHDGENERDLAMKWAAIGATDWAEEVLLEAEAHADLIGRKRRTAWASYLQDSSMFWKRTDRDKMPWGDASCTASIAIPSTPGGNTTRKASSLDTKASFHLEALDSSQSSGGPQRSSRPRFCVQVSANRPFSAPHVRCARAGSGGTTGRQGRSGEPAAPAPRENPGRSTPRRTACRPASAAAQASARPSLGTEKAVRPCSALTTVQRPRSAFGYAATVAERPPVSPSCEPQARWMASGGSTNATILPGSWRR